MIWHGKSSSTPRVTTPVTQALVTPLRTNTMTWEEFQYTMSYHTGDTSPSDATAY